MNSEKIVSNAVSNIRYNIGFNLDNLFQDGLSMFVAFSIIAMIIIMFFMNIETT